MGRTHAGTCVILLVQDLQTRVINAATGELLRDPTLEPSRDYQPTGAPKGPSCKNPEMNNIRFLRHHSCSGESVLVQVMSNTCL